MKLSSLSNETLLNNTKNLAQREREITLEVLHHLREVEKRLLFAELAYPSLFEYAVNELKYSQSAAFRRISSMRLLKELPEIEEKIESGALSLSVVAQAQSFFKQEGTSNHEKREVLNSLENKSAREVQKELVSRSSEPHKIIPEKLRSVSATYSELKLLIADELVAELEELRNLLSHKLPGARFLDVISYSAKHTLKSHRPKGPRPLCSADKDAVTFMTKTAQIKDETKLATARTSSSLPTSNVTTRYISADVKRQVWQRDHGCCTYSHRGKRCSSKKNLEFDHIKPFSFGGETNAKNLRLRCRVHNQLAAVQVFGRGKMSKFVLNLR